MSFITFQKLPDDMIEACREGMYFISYKYNTCIKFVLSFMVLSIIMAHVLL